MRVTPRSTRKAAALLTVVGVVLGTGLASPGSYASGSTRAAPHRVAASHDGGRHNESYDSRMGTSAASKAAVMRRSAKASSRKAVKKLGASLDNQVLVDMDGTTKTPRLLARLDGYLTGPRSAPAREVAMGYVRAHLAAIGLSKRDLKTFKLRRDYVDVTGIHHLSWTQSEGGILVYGNGLQANVTRNGRLLSLGGSPIAGLDAPETSPREVASKRAAIAAARRDLGEPTKSGPRDTARQTLFVTRLGTHLGWRVITMSANQPAVTVVDAHSGNILLRKSLGADERAKPEPTGTKTSAGIAYRYFPGHRPRGGVATGVNYTKLGWLPADADILSGNNSHTYSDVNDDNSASSSEEVPPSAPHRWNYRLKPFQLPAVSFCGNPYPCSWNPDQPFSWQANRAQNAAQVFFFVNNWHDHLLARPIGFTEAAGNFQMRNKTHKGVGGDLVDTQTEDGADIDNGLPDGSHVDNANMDTPPDGQQPTMQMYLQHSPGTTYPDGDPFAPTNVGDEADTVYHEYTHGLSNRLVVDPGGVSSLGVVEAGAMGEAWSDWYAMDFLVQRGLQADQPHKVDVVLYQYDGQGSAVDRTEPLDCKVGSRAARCNGGETGHLGGYTYADYGKVIGFPEVHGDSEIWSQALWDLRDRLGSRKTEALVTRAMELSPSNPSFLDERNSLLLADTSVFGGRNHAAIWRVLAHRGMGYFAGSLGGDDSTPGADFHMPPARSATGFLHGTVKDLDTGKAVPGAAVTLAFQGGSGTVNPSAVTGSDGRYRIGPVPVGTYRKLVTVAPGYDSQTTRAVVTRNGATKNFQLRRDWAALSGGASIADFNGPDYSPGCGPEEAIDGSLATGWGSSTGDDNGTPTNQFVPKFITVDLPSPVNITGFAVDPSASCGDGGSASLSGYRIETSADGTTWTTVASGTFTSDDNGRLNAITPSTLPQGVRHLRFWMLGNQTPDFATNCPDGAYSGCSFTDMTELQAYGSPSS